MANRYAIATGNWNNAAIWDGGTTIPTVGDDVRANGFTVTINQDITVTTLRTDALSPAVSGGTFIVTGNGRIVNANLQTGTTSVIQCNTTINWFLNGNIGAYSAVNVSCVQLLFAASFTMVGNVLSNGASSSNGQCIRASSTMNINITGNVTGGTNGVCHGVAIDSGFGGNINITGNIIGGNGSSAVGVLLNNNGQILTVNGTIIGGTVLYGVQNTLGTLQGNCIAQTGTGSAAILGSGSATTTISEAIFTDAGSPIAGKVRFKNINPKVTVVKANGTTQQLVEAGASGDFPITANVRNGITYASGSLTGTLIVPTPDNVRKDIGTDATIGTADLTAADMWNYLTTNLTTSGSIGERMKNVSTVQTTGDQMSSFNV